MLTSHSDRVCAFFAVDFEPLLSFEGKLGGAAEIVHERLNIPHWGFGTGRFVLRDTKIRLIVIIDFRRIFLQTLGLEPWTKNLERYAETVVSCLKKLGVTKLKRIGFNTQAYLPIGMSHKEMADLMPGSFLAPAEELVDVCGKFEDVLIQLHGTHDNMKLQVIVAPMTKEQSTQQFMGTNNLEAFLEHKLADSGVKEFRDRVATDCFHVNADLFREEVSDSETTVFLKRAFDAADKITEAAVQKLKSLRVKKGS